MSDILKAILIGATLFCFTAPSPARAYVGHENLAAGDTGLSDELGARLFAEVQGHPNPGDMLSLIIMITTLPPKIENTGLQKSCASLLRRDGSRSFLFSAIFESLTLDEKHEAALTKGGFKCTS